MLTADAVGDSGGGGLMERVPFETLKEGWGEYRLPDGLVIRLRGQLVFVWRESGKPEKQQVRTNVTVVSAAPPEIQGEPSKRPVDFERDEPAARYTQWETVSEASSLYMFPNGSLFLVRVTPFEVRRYATYTPDREPMVQVLHSDEFAVTPSLYGDAEPREIQVGPGAKLSDAGRARVSP